MKNSFITPFIEREMEQKVSFGHVKSELTLRLKNYAFGSLQKEIYSFVTGFILKRGYV